ncbi:aminopeptidase I zinc metalloprotease M18 [Nitzschia inconspicua]|uniref:aspartyl aminopeptidase n=1 Tax=Nitzschia inconspicua TaxID=303405 RepID=A0A9K3KN19_9STRA|nr:aminopeptidase I zinc metalloprotease M18 [Nitzschia inconspicua]KAG7345858.1 aminopeptidase I zinc metalloprotease M18 [Nitzschia inconspicua]KAG7362334.1 aminopeptidase I zinc metalloprotease M18 [Nitzschia inconspicua]KAG7365603.1 aminopeptidase I zinc metalloprotease M18 [Nitzschia inconspicua]
MSSSSQFAEYIPLAEKACDFLTASPDPFHAVHNCVQKLKAAGFVGLDSTEPLTGKLQPGGKYYYIVEHSTLVAFAVGPKCSIDTTNGSTIISSFGFHMIGGHTDSPNLKIKPKSKRTASGCILLGVECYGGGLWHTWFDRDLSVSGRVLVQQRQQQPNNDNDNTSKPLLFAKTEQRLVNLKDPIARISTLCIHLQSPEERQGFTVNKENHTSPIIATESIRSKENNAAKEKLEQDAESQLNGNTSKWREAQEPLLLDAIAEKLGVDKEEIVDFELNLYDTQPASLGGITKEFLYSARLDNLATVFCAMESLVQYTTGTDSTFSESADVSLAVVFDHEEVGSVSAQGAGSPVMSSAVERIAAALNGGSVNPDVYNACIRKSFILSIDQAHAIHPNYASKHEAQHAPKLNSGIVIKTNNNQRYATTGITGFVVRELGRIAAVPVQEFVVRNDCPCGSTIGPTVSANTGIRVVDAGMPQLSMHSCREVMGIVDLTHGVNIFKAFYNHFRDLDDSLSKQIDSQ